MIKILAPLVGLLTCGAWLAVTAACGRSSFQANRGQSNDARRFNETPEAKEGGSQEPSSRRPDEGQGSTSEPTGDSEHEESDRPQPVTGAFLTCARFSAPEEAAGAGESYGCRIERDRDTVDLRSAAVSWDVLDAGTKASRRAEVRVTSAVTELWHLELTIPRGMGRGLIVRALVDWQRRGRPETLEMRLESAPAMLRFGQNHDIRLGNGLVGPSCFLKVGLEPLRGRAIAMPFTVLDKPAQVAFALNGICGADFRNLVRLQRGDAVVQELVIPKGQAILRSDAVTLEPGNYEIHIESVTRGSGDPELDDFVIGDVFVEAAAGQLLGQKPVVLE